MLLAAVRRHLALATVADEFIGRVPILYHFLIAYEGLSHSPGTWRQGLLVQRWNYRHSKKIRRCVERTGK